MRAPDESHDRGARRRRLTIAGRLLLAGGAAALCWAATDWTRGALARDRARAAWEAREAHAAVLAAATMPLGGESVVDARVPDGTPVARLRIPRLGLDEVVVEGVDADALRAGPGHMPGTPLPGRPGNAVVSAHRDRHFHALGELAVGDTVATESDAGRMLWIVTARRVVDREARALHPSATPELTLTTCWPIRWLGSAPDRLLVTAKPIVQVAVGNRAP